MSNTLTFGKVSWQDIGKKTNKIFDKEKFLKLEDGVNNVRLITDAYRYFYHKVEFEGDTNKFGRSVRCTTVKEECPLCLQGKRPSEKFYIGVIDRKSNKTKILECGKTIIEGIQGLSQIPGKENSKQYELVILKNSKNGPNMYTVIPGDVRPLTAAEIQMAEDFDEDHLLKLCEPKSAEEIIKEMERIKVWIDKNKVGGSSPHTQMQIAAAQLSEEKISDESFEFNIKRKK